MKYFPLVWAALWRKPARTIFTFLSIVVAFLLFGMLAGLDGGFARQLAGSRADRLLTNPRFGTPLPYAYVDKVARVPGVIVVAPRTQGICGYYKNRRNVMCPLGVDERFFRVRDELSVTRDQIAQMQKTRTAALLGDGTATRFHIKVGDRITLVSSTVAKNGSPNWVFDIIGIIHDSRYPGEAYYFTTNYKYLDEARPTQNGTVDRILTRIQDGSKAVEVGKAIDALFANSAAPTRTGSELAGYQANQQALGDVKFFTRAVISAVLFMLLFLTGNTMMQSVRERTNEFGVLKTLGFSDRGILAMVFAESILLCGVAAGTGLLLIKLAFPLIKTSLPAYSLLLILPWSSLLTGLGFAVLVALASGFIPARRAQRLNVVDALAGR